MGHSSSSAAPRQDRSQNTSAKIHESNGVLPNHIISDSRLNDADRVVLMGLAMCAGARKKTAVSIETISKLIHKSPRSIRESLARLRSLGLVWMMRDKRLITGRWIILAWRRAAKENRETPLPPPCDDPPPIQIAEPKSSPLALSGADSCAEQGDETAPHVSESQPSQTKIPGPKRKTPDCANFDSLLGGAGVRGEGGTWPKFQMPKFAAALDVIANPESKGEAVDRSVELAAGMIVGVLGNSNSFQKIMKILWKIARDGRDHNVLVSVFCDIEASVLAGTLRNPGGAFYHALYKAWEVQEWMEDLGEQGGLRTYG